MRKWLLEIILSGIEIPESGNLHVRIKMHIICRLTQIHTTTCKTDLKICFVLFQFVFRVLFVIAYCTVIKTSRHKNFNETLLECMYLKKENNCKG